MPNFRKPSNILFAALCVIAAAVLALAAGNKTLAAGVSDRKPILIEDGWTVTTTLPSASYEKTVLTRNFMYEEYVSLDLTFCLFFKTLNKRVRVFQDGREIYSFGHGNTHIVGVASGLVPHIVLLFMPEDPSAGSYSTVSIEILTDYGQPDMAFHKFASRGIIDIPEIWGGTRLSCLTMHSRGCMKFGLTAFLLFSIGLIGLVFFAVFIRGRNTVRFLKWGLYAIGTSLMLFSESELWYPSIPFVGMWYILNTLGVALFPAMTLFFVHDTKTILDNTRVSAVIRAVSLCQGLLVCAASFRGLDIFIIARAASYITLMVFSIYVIFTSCYSIIMYTGVVNHRVMTTHLMLVCIIIDMFTSMLYPTEPRAFRISAFTMPLFFISQNAALIKEFINSVTLNGRSAMLEQMLTTEPVTGCRNFYGFREFHESFAEEMLRDGRRVCTTILLVENVIAVNGKFGYKAERNLLRSVGMLLSCYFDKERLFYLPEGLFVAVEADLQEEEAQIRQEEILSMLNSYSRSEFGGTAKFRMKSEPYDRKFGGNYREYFKERLSSGFAGTGQDGTGGGSPERR